MAGLGAKLFTAFSKLTAAQVNGYLMDQSIMRFATSAARDAAFGGAGEPTLTEGMTCYLDDTNVLQSYNGTTWVSVAASQITANVSSGLVYITSLDLAGTTTGANLDGCFTSTYDTYQMIVSNYRAASGGYLYVQTRASGVTDTGTNYVYNENLGAANINQTEWRLTYAYNATDRGNSVTTIYNPFSSATGTMCSTSYSARNSTTSFFTNFTGSQKQTQTSDTGLRFTSSSGAVAMNGIITIYGYTK